MLPRDPRTLLLLDGSGAVLTALTMVFVLAQFEDFFGLPAFFAYVLGGLGALYGGFSFSSALREMEDRRPLLKLIAGANLGYCLLSLGLMILHQDQLSLFGQLYLCGEILIVGLLAKFELRVAQR